ncbi:4Fe-4S binding protein [Gudongella sp. DL1XJH-153]|uniref:4Fe-4S binding protein n=1 Tax=Gudongella sp. DL1XJH-153 TaxID=3409804 RepID=UPI003BB64607
MTKPEFTKTDFICAVGKELNIINTGDWKMYPVVIDQDKCIKCSLCFQYCPTKSVKYADGTYFINPDFCKGCGVCIEECRSNAIDFVKGE